MKKKAPPHPTLAQLRARIEELERLVTQRSSPCCHHIVTQSCALPHYPCTLPHQPTVTWGWPPIISSGSTSIIVTKPLSTGVTHPSFTLTANTQH